MVHAKVEASTENGRPDYQASMQALGRWRTRLADHAYTRPWLRWAVHRRFEVVRVACDCGYISAPMLPEKAARWLADQRLHGAPEYGHGNLRIVARETRFLPRWEAPPERIFA